MSNPLIFNGKPLELFLSRSAAWALQQRETPLYVRMELLFSCLVKKNLIFHRESPLDLACEEVAPGLHLGFQAMMNRSCGLGAEAQLVEYPVARFAAVQPKWLQLDQHQGEFRGEFGFRLAEAPRPTRFPGRLILALAIPL